ncbi:MAG: hypothetical protein H0U57_12940 [Tatlockia sp.]|nr:hypothetical protein [Tatlockia sp.]
MQHRLELEEFKERFQARKERIEKNLNKPKGINLAFLSQKPQKIELTAVAKFLKHLNDFEDETQKLINENTENADFYNSHLENVRSLLANIERKFPDPSSLEPEDFILTVPTDVEYKKTYTDSIMTFLDFGLFGALIGGIIVGLIAALAGLVGAMYFIFPTGVALPSPEGLGILMAIAACLSGAVGFIVGGIVGGLLGFLVGFVVTPFLDKPLNNEYINNTAFDCSLLKAAYAEIIQSGIGCANEEGFETEGLTPLKTSFS